MKKETKSCYAHLRVSPELMKKARALNVKISKTCREAIAKEVQKRERPKTA